MFATKKEIKHFIAAKSGPVFPYKSFFMDILNEKIFVLLISQEVTTVQTVY